jgi:hypothetical protein
VARLAREYCNRLILERDIEREWEKEGATGNDFIVLSRLGRDGVDGLMTMQATRNGV